MRLNIIRWTVKYVENVYVYPKMKKNKYIKYKYNHVMMMMISITRFNQTKLRTLQFILFLSLALGFIFKNLKMIVVVDGLKYMKFVRICIN